ncbi:MAG: acyl-CoA dehydrogenase family protein [Gammaproteobacteria bacterium]|nr:acyl-CoA dehydrogenase family protein [Gammaproteobacteria bacterium]
MDFRLTEDQNIIVQTARQFADNEMAPFASEWDSQHIFPKEVLRKSAELGLAAINVRTDVGGSELSRLISALVFEELATACPSTAAYLSIHNMVSSLMDRYGSETIRTKWLPKLATLELFSSYCLTEPSAGSDAASLKTTAVREGDFYIINGAKAFISGGSASDLYLCMVRTGGEGAKGISCMLVENGTAGLSFGKREPKLGWHSQPTTMVFFENVRIPVANLVGREGEGFKMALSALNGGRVNIAACSLGGAKKCLALSRDYLLEREQFKQKLAQFEALQFRIADMLTELESARLMVYRAASALDHHDQEAMMYCAMAKRLATDLGFKICDQALQLFGGYGYIQDYPIERYFRDLRVHQILEGTNEIMRLIIARQIFAKDFVVA